MAKKQKAGRKRLPPMEKAVLVGFYAKRYDIEKKGGIVAVRDLCKKMVENSFVVTGG